MRLELINYGRWYYEHASSYMAVMVRADTGERAYHDKLLRQGHEVLIRNATPAEHAQMVVLFDEIVDDLAYGRDNAGFVSGIGNFERDDPEYPLERVAAAVAVLKSRARYEPGRETP